MNIEDTDSEDDLRSEDDDDYYLSDEEMEAPDIEGDIIVWEELRNVVVCNNCKILNVQWRVNNLLT